MVPPAEFWDTDIDYQDWADIQVPGECQMQGFAIKHDEPFVYKKEFLIPKDYEGKEVRLVFYGVYSYARVWVNGKFIREHSGGFTRWECDISDMVSPGEMAVLTIEVTDRADDISYGSGYAKHQIGGILRDVELIALPEQNFEQLYFETDLDEHYKNADLNIFYDLKKDTPSKIRVDLFDTDDLLVGSVEGKAKGDQLSLAVKNPELWDAEHPNLYTVVTTLIQEGKEVMKMYEKIGFREVRVEGNKLLVNSMPVKLRGACRHDIHPTLGRMTTAEYDLQDVLLAKECNMNFIRTSHYPPSETFLHYCDQYGIYVEDETAVCFVGSHRTKAYQASGASQSDPEFIGRYLSQLEEMVQNHRNHPSIIIWSIGNENSFGSNFVESYNWVKKNDPTRPVIYSYPGQVPDSLLLYELISMHYPNWKGNLDQYRILTEGFESADMPMLFDEWAHVACYNNFELREDPNVRNFWGQSLDSMWTYLFETEGGLGGAIWCMLDETFMMPEDLEGFNDWWGILDKNVIPATFNRPVVGYGEWGIVDIWRRKKPEFWGTKKAYSPTKIYSKTLPDFSPGEELMVPVHNRFDHTNFSELKILWQYGEQSGELGNTDLKPHQKGQLVFPPNDWNTDEKLQIQFYQ
ncbi:MAG: glycoside hydrolase family 2 TIM barrel-domain containing protein, partial [Bacteroidota bacterium]|nr:glycoside hydrolase family 2 TIM barrel-domain containing protein [Bacteroidota bacterium]